MNAGGVFKACKSNEIFGSSGKRVSNALVTCLSAGDNGKKFPLIPDSLSSLMGLRVKIYYRKRGLRTISLLVR